MRHALAGLIEHAKHVLRAGVALRRRQPVRGHCHGIVALKAKCCGVIGVAHPGLRRCHAVVGRELVPNQRLAAISQHPTPLLVSLPQHEPRFLGAE
jgi:hypothetical protein